MTLDDIRWLNVSMKAEITKIKQIKLFVKKAFQLICEWRRRRMLGNEIKILLFIGEFEVSCVIFYQLYMAYSKKDKLRKFFNKSCTFFGFTYKSLFLIIQVRITFLGNIAKISKNSKNINFITEKITFIHKDYYFQEL